FRYRVGHAGATDAGSVAETDDAGDGDEGAAVVALGELAVPPTAAVGSEAPVTELPDDAHPVSRATPARAIAATVITMRVPGTRCFIRLSYIQDHQLLLP